MTNRGIFSNRLIAEQRRSDQHLNNREQAVEDTQTLPILVTRLASKQTYYTIRFLVDREHVLDAYRAYGYFRWLDDFIDQKLSPRSEQIAFVERQQALMNACYEGGRLGCLTAEERMLVDLIKSDQEPNSGLRSYVQNMMSVMAFDANRRGRLISQDELARYSRSLSVAVTDALHYFIGHDDPSPQTESRYLAVMGAHITHMLRDSVEDIAAGYFNIPCEFLESHRIEAGDVQSVQSDGYREWVESRVQLARHYFAAGKDYLTHIKNLRFRLACYAYTARFEVVLDAIETEGYRLRAEYPERKQFRGKLSMSWSLLSMLAQGLVRGTR